MVNQKHRDQIADLILKSPDGKDLEIRSKLTTHHGVTSFEVGDPGNDQTWTVRLSIEESDRTVESVMSRPLNGEKKLKDRL